MDQFVGNKAKRRISKRLFQEIKARGNMRVSEGNKFVFRKIWPALFSWNTHFEIRPFALLPTSFDLLYAIALFLCPLKTWENKRYSHFFGQYRKRPVVWEGFSEIANYPVRYYVFKVNNRNARTRCQICSKLTIKAQLKICFKLTLNTIDSSDFSKIIFE